MLRPERWGPVHIQRQSSHVINSQLRWGLRSKNSRPGELTASGAHHTRRAAAKASGRGLREQSNLLARTAKAFSMNAAYPDFGRAGLGGNGALAHGQNDAIDLQ